jgi:nucleotide-binding universal stress UspA family protein
MTDIPNEGHFKVLLGDDRSEHAQAAVSLLEDLPLPPGTEVTVFRAFSPNQSTDLILMEDALNQTCLRLREKGLHAQPTLLLGSPAEKMVKYAEEAKPDLIILGARGLRSTLGILLGGVAQQVVEYAPCPVLVVRAPYAGLRSILLATDGSPSSGQALQFLGRLPLPSAANLWLMHVLPPQPLPVIMVGMPALEMPVPPLELEELAGWDEKELQEGRALVEDGLAELRALGRQAQGLLKKGDAATEIIAMVKEKDIDLLVTGSRGLSPIKRWMMGSVSRKLVHYAGCSVLVVRRMAEG